MDALLEAFNDWGTANRDLAYFLGFVAFALIFYYLHPFRIGLNQAVANDTAFHEMDVERQVKKPHRPILLASGIAAFAILHFVFGMAGLALIVGGVAIGALTIIDMIQIDRDNPPPA